MTTYGVSSDSELLPALASLYNFDDDNGARCAVYEEGIDIPVAIVQSKPMLGKGMREGRTYVSGISERRPSILD